MNSYISNESTLELQKENMKFSVSHFTIFSSTNRENLHGHNYQVALHIQTESVEEGLNFDYRFYRSEIYKLCDMLNQTTLIAKNSKHLQIDSSDTHHIITFNHESFSLLKRDVTLLPVTNITVEELSRWFIEHLSQDHAQLKSHHIQSLKVKIFSTPGQSGSATWINEAM